MLTKLEVARRQLGTALALFLENGDPVSVHTLACSGGEISQRLAELAGGEPFARHALAQFPDITPVQLKGLRNKYWNTLKHATDRAGLDRADEMALASFSDDLNDHHLLIGWYDYAIAAATLPVEAQVFQVWYFAKYPDKLRDNADCSDYFTEFPDLNEVPRSEQKQRLRSSITRARGRHEIIDDVRTDRRPLILPNWAEVSDA
jgi:hypothetical protein